MKLSAMDEAHQWELVVDIGTCVPDLSLHDSTTGRGTSDWISVEERVCLQRCGEPPEILLIEILMLAYQVTLPISITLLFETGNRQCHGR
jgi:hypothetical protein